jgi:hypothetical protein
LIRSSLTSPQPPISIFGIALHFTHDGAVVDTGGSGRVYSPDSRTGRHEWLDSNIIETIEEAEDLTMQWLWTYNKDCPNMFAGGIKPAQRLMIAAKILRKSLY